MNIVRTIGNNIHCFQCIGRNTHTFSRMMVSIRPEELYTLKKNVYDLKIVVDKMKNDYNLLQWHISTLEQKLKYTNMNQSNMNQTNTHPNKI